MRWPWRKREKRDSGGDFSDAVVRLIEAQAAGKAADASSTAAVEAAAGALSRAFASARVEGPPHVQEAVTGRFLAQAGRDLIRSGDSMHLIHVDMMGKVTLLPSSSWHFEGDAHPDTWMVRATYYGPSTSTTMSISYSGVVFVTWGSTPGQPYVGTGPLSWAHTTARLQSEAERSLTDEAQGPLAQLLAIPSDGGDGGEEDPLATLKADLRSARGKALLLETTHAGWGDGRSAAPQRDWQASRLGPTPPESMVRVRSDAFEAVLAATGTPPSLFIDSDGTSQREAIRRWHQNVVLPMARLLQDELSEKLEAEVRLVFDSYPLDLAGRAQAFQKLVAGGVPVNEALATSGLLADG
ncbi:MAG: phage portal protein [Gammaproteobacteria bacterium]|nr:phage portal protein [Gammaproteobacteria bacterium]MYK69071.1 phage portal protein [Gammaproteobacteria bacterium]